MGQELLEKTGYVRTPRKYFVATNSKGYRVIRGSADRDYFYCVIAKELNAWGSIYASFSATEHNAKKYCKTWNNRYDEEAYEVVKCVQVTAKEVRVIKKEIRLEVTQYRAEQERLQAEQDRQGRTPTQVSEGTKEDKENN
jgi:hypothetical protein